MLGFINNVSQMRVKQTKQSKHSHVKPPNKVDVSMEGQVKNLISNIQSMNIRN
jgi:hypothetical protein